MFTKFSKVILWFWIFGGIIASVVLASPFLKNDYTVGTGVGIILVGIAVTFFSFAFLGMLIEIAENIADSRKFLYEINRKLANPNKNSAAQAASQTGNSNSNGGTFSYKTDENGNQVLVVKNDGGFSEAADEPWKCPHCQFTNRGKANICVNCGAPRQ